MGREREREKKAPVFTKSIFKCIICNYSSIFPQPNKMGHDVSTGIIEFILDHFTEENEGTFTCQITDGGGKAQSSLVLIGDGKNRHTLCASIWISVKRDFYYILLTIRRKI